MEAAAQRMERGRHTTAVPQPHTGAANDDDDDELKEEDEDEDENEDEVEDEDEEKDERAVEILQLVGSPLVADLSAPQKSWCWWGVGWRRARSTRCMRLWMRYTTSANRAREQVKEKNM